MKNPQSSGDLSAAVRIATSVNHRGISPESMAALLRVAAQVPHHGVPEQLVSSVTEATKGDTGPSHDWD